MKKVGITGGIGSGKTIVCNVFDLLGVPVYYADDRAKEILDDKKVVFEAVIELFGATILDASGKIDKGRLASIVFNDGEKLEQLNKIIHPAVANDFEDWCKIKSETPYILKEAAILFESGSHKNMDFIITVTAPEEMRIQRVVDRNHITKEEVISRMSKQISDKEKIKRSDFVIVNDEEHLVIPQILEIHKQLNANN